MAAKVFRVVPILSINVQGNIKLDDADRETIQKRTEDRMFRGLNTAAAEEQAVLEFAQRKYPELDIEEAEPL